MPSTPPPRQAPPPQFAADTADIAESGAARRAVCERCLRARRTCICHWITPVVCDTALLILQHPLEVRQAKGSARLLHLCVPGSVMLTGEQFDPALLHQTLHAGGRTPVLLYPDNAEDGAAANQAVADIAALRGQGAGLRLVVLDGTWRKSRKMLYLNPALVALPRLALRDAPPSHYRIRKAHAPDQLSSFEAAAYALMGLQAKREGEAGLAHLLAAFDGFVDEQAAHVPPALAGN